MNAATWVPFGLTLLGLLVGGGTLLDVLIDRRRLAGRLSSDLDILAKLPEGRAHDALRERVERDALTLAASGIPYTPAEQRRRALAAGLFVALLVVRSFSVRPATATPPVWFTLTAYVVLAVAGALYWWAWRSRERRRHARGRLTDRGKPWAGAEA